MPQISFQINVATVEYRPQKSLGGYKSYGGGAQGGGINGMLSGYGQAEQSPTTGFNTGKNGGLFGIDASQDRGDEINLDELNSYIGR